MGRRLRIGIIGCGAITERLHAPDVHDSLDAELAACCDTDRRRAEFIAESFGTEARVFTDYKALLRESDAEAVIVALPNVLHGPVTVEAARSGRHVLVEKPMATSIAEARRMIAAAAKAKVLLMVNQSQRLEPSHLKAKEVLDSGILGKVLHVSGIFGHSGPDNWSAAAKWFFRKKEARFGAMADLGVHKADLIRYLTGKEVAAVGAFVERVEKQRTDVDDNFAACLKFTDGTVGTLAASWTVKGRSETHTIFHCSKGTLRVQTEPERPVVAYLEHPSCEVVFDPPPPANDYEGTWGLDVAGRFARACMGLEAPFCTGEEGLRSLQIIFAAEASARTGRIVKIKG